MPESSLIFTTEIDLQDAADRIRSVNSPLADLLEAVADIDAESLHTVMEWPGGETECADDCTPCNAKYAAQMVAAPFLRNLPGGTR